MNKVRITGIAILLLAIALGYFVDNDRYDFWLGAAGGLGISLVVIGKFKRAG